MTAETVRLLVAAGFTRDSAMAAVDVGDLRLLAHAARIRVSLRRQA